MKSIRATFTDSIHRINAAYNRLPDPDQVNIFTPQLDQLHRDIEVHWQTGDEPAARQAIKTWEQAHHEAFKRAVK